MATTVELSGAVSWWWRRDATERAHGPFDSKEQAMLHAFLFE